MAYYVFEEFPHNILKSAADRDELKQEMLEDFERTIRFLLRTRDEVSLRFHAAAAPGRCGMRAVEVGYVIGDGEEPLDAYFEATRRFVRLRREPNEPPVARPRVQLQRRVNLVPVGGVDRTGARELRLLPVDAPRFVDFTPRFAAYDPHRALEMPLTFVLSELAGIVMPTRAYLAPLPQTLSIAESRERWRNVLKVLASDGGTISIKFRRKDVSRTLQKYATTCVQYYVATVEGKAPLAEVEQNTALFRALLSAQPTYTCEFSFDDCAAGIVEAFTRDTDPSGFEIAGQSELDWRLRAELLDGSSTASSRDLHEPPSPRRSLPQSSSDRQCPPPPECVDPPRDFARLFRLDDAVQLLIPPYTCHDALPGVRHFVPKPFRAPMLARADHEAIIHIGSLEDGTPVTIPTWDITRHMFVTGGCGSGKSWTTMNAVCQLDAQRVPVLLIDPVKRDFEPMMDGLGLGDRVIDFSTRWLRFNPFIPPERVTLYSHAVVLAKTLSMLFPTNAVAYEILLGMVKETYIRKLSIGRAHPIDTETFLNRTGADLRRDKRKAPTFAEFLEIGIDTLRRPPRHDGETGRRRSSFMEEAIEHFERRWEGLRRSAFTVMLSPSRDPYRPIDWLFARTHLLEFGEWFDQNEVNAAFALVVAMLFEHRRDLWRKSREQGGILPLHVSVLDEAHRIIPRTQGGGDDRLISAGRETAELFGNMVAEIREWGEGLIIAEQSASRIHANVLINAATKIVHATSYGEDKDSLCTALALSDREADHLSFLRVGEGLAQIPQTYQPVFMRVPDWRTQSA